MNFPVHHEPVVATLVDGLPAGESYDAPPVATPIATHVTVPMELDRLVAEPLIPEPVAVAVPVEALPGPEPMSLERRIEILERTIRDTQNLEARITARVLEKIPESALPRSHWYDRVNPFKNVAAPAATGWLLFDLLGEFRFVGAMIFDSRFGMNWLSHVVIAAALVLAFTIHIWLTPFGLLPFVGSTLVWLLTILTQLVCGGLIYKILHRETTRYRQFLETR